MLLELLLLLMLLTFDQYSLLGQKVKLAGSFR